MLPRSNASAIVKPYSSQFNAKRLFCAFAPHSTQKIVLPRFCAPRTVTPTITPNRAIPLRSFPAFAITLYPATTLPWSLAIALNHYADRRFKAHALLRSYASIPLCVIYPARSRLPASVLLSIFISANTCNCILKLILSYDSFLSQCPGRAFLWSPAPSHHSAWLTSNASQFFATKI